MIVKSHKFKYQQNSEIAKNLPVKTIIMIIMSPVCASNICCLGTVSTRGGLTTVQRTFFFNEHTRNGHNNVIIRVALLCIIISCIVNYRSI